MAYSLVLDAAMQLSSLNLQWFIDLVMTNLLWVFVFAAATLFIFGEKKLFAGFLAITFFIWAFVDISIMAGWAFAGMALIASYFAASIALQAVADSGNERLSKNIGIASTMLFFAFWLGYYFFFG